MDLLESGADIEDVVKSLGEDETVERRRLDATRHNEVGGHGGVGIPLVDVQDVASADLPAEPTCVVGVLDLEHASANPLPVLLQETLDVVPVDGRAALAPEVVAQGRRSTDCSQPGRAPKPHQPLSAAHPIGHSGSVPTSCGRQHGEDDALRDRMPSERPRILVEPNAHHLLNLGDVAMLQVAVGRLRSLWPEAPISVITDDPVRLATCCPGTHPVPAAGRRLWFDSSPFTYTLQHIAPRQLSRRVLESERVLRRRAPGAARRLVRARAALARNDVQPLDEFLQAVHTADIVVSSGAGAFNDEFASLAISILDLLRMAGQAGAVTAVLGHGVGPITDPMLLRRARQVLPHVDLVTLRERVAGRPLLASFGVPEDRILVTGDDAVELAYEAQSDGDAGYLGFNLRMARYAHVDQRAADTVAAAVRGAAASHQCRLLSVPISHYPTEVDGAVNAALLGTPNELAEEVGTPRDVVELIGRCRAVVTGSYHAAVFALAQGIPAVGLTASAYYDAKFVGLADQFGGSGLWIVSTRPDQSIRSPRPGGGRSVVARRRPEARPPRICGSSGRERPAGLSPATRTRHGTSGELVTRRGAGLWGWARRRPRTLPFNLDDAGSHRWEERAEAAVELLVGNVDTLRADPSAGLRIADFGAGDQRLRRILAAQTELQFSYASFDIRPQADSVVQIDLRHELPPGDFDLVACLGLLEYLEEVPTFLDRLAARYPAALLSYSIVDHPAPLTRRQRRSRGWLSDYTTAQFEHELEGAGFARVASRRVSQGRTGIWLVASHSSMAASSSSASSSKS